MATITFKHTRLPGDPIWNTGDELCGSCNQRAWTHNLDGKCPPYAMRNTTDEPAVFDAKVTEQLAAHKSEGKPAVGDMDTGFILAMGEVMTQGLTKYPNDADGKPNWYKGGSLRGFASSILRHVCKLMRGEWLDDESGLPHVAHIAVDSMFIWSWRTRSVGKEDLLA